MASMRLTLRDYALHLFTGELVLDVRVVVVSSLRVFVHYSANVSWKGMGS